MAAALPLVRRGLRGLATPALALSLFAVSCAPEGKNAPVRSPTLDYPHPPARTSDGRVVGVDEKPPSDWVGEHASSAGMAPGWKADGKGISYDAQRRVGGSVLVGDDHPAGSAQPQCKPPPPPRFPRLERTEPAVEGCDHQTVEAPR